MGDWMHLVEQHRIDRHDPRLAAIDTATFASKNLYNAALNHKRQAYIFEHQRIVSFSDLDKLMQPTVEYRKLPAQVAQWVVKQVCAAWDCYFAVVSEWQIHPETLDGQPKLPEYLAKDRRNQLVYTNQAISRDTKEHRLGRAIRCTDPRRDATAPCRGRGHERVPAPSHALATA
jgi:hypothetical protein